MTAISRTLAATCIVAASLSAHAAGSVDVKFVKPESFSDAGRDRIDRDRTQQRLNEYFQQLGNKLPDGQALNVEVLDIDLAGEMKMMRKGPDQRVMKGSTDIPRIKLRFSLVAGGQTLKSGEETVSDMAYLERGLTRQSLGDLGYERRMLDEWFAKQILAGAAVSK